jgi:hypothetical protein
LSEKQAEKPGEHGSSGGLGERLKALLRPIIPLRYRPQALFDRLVEKATGDVVCGGPFEGMEYIDEARQQFRLLPRLLGTYEIELWGPLEQAIECGYQRIVNVGAGEGYYVVGLARAIRGAEVIAFEDNSQRQDLVRRMATHNGVGDRVTVFGRCEVSDLAQAVGNGEGCLLVMDVEGAEMVLLDPQVSAGLARCTVLVEIHDFVDDTLSSVIRSRFAPTHDIVEIDQRDRTLADFPLRTPLGTGRLLSKRYIKSMDEGRPAQMNWFAMTPRR